MNFVARKGFALDYQHLGVLFLIWMLLLVIVTGIMYFRLWRMRHVAEEARLELAALMQDQERRLATLQSAGPKIDRAKQQYLINIFENPPHWSRVIGELQSRIPQNVSLTVIKSSEDTKQEQFRLRVEGEATSMRSIVEFLQRLKTCPIFRDVTLTEAKHHETNKAIFTYVIEAQVLVLGA
jgi:Tfp pilus assembly protein PilN